MFDKFLQKYSYKFDKGYPDMANEKDILLLEEILAKLDITSINLRERAPLSTRDLAKPIKGAKDRGEVLLKKIENEDSLKLLKGGEIKIDLEKSKGFIDNLKNGTYNVLSKLPFYDTEGNAYTIGKLEKSEEFGGKAIARGMEIEDRELSNLLNQIDELGGSVDIKIGDTVYKNIVSGHKPTGNPKADFILYNSDDEAKIFISHKDSNGFQQYSGISIFMNDSEVISFVNDVKQATNSQFEPKTAFQREIQGKDLQLDSVYGHDGKFGLNKVQIVCQGEMTLKKISDGLYSLESQHNFTYPEIPTNNFKPKLLVTYRRGMNSQGVKNARFGIYPQQQSKIVKVI